MHTTLALLIFARAGYARIHIPCALSLESTPTASSLAARAEAAWTFAPAPVRRLRRAWFESGAKELTAVNDRLKREFPLDLVTPVLTQHGLVNVRHVADAAARPALLTRLPRAKRLLERSLELSDEVHGPRSTETGLAHFALSIFYASTSSQKRTIEPALHRNFDPFDAYQRRSEHHAREAARILTARTSPYAPVARLHWIRRLAYAAKSLASDGNGMGKGKPYPEFELWFEEAEREARRFLGEFSTVPTDKSIATYLSAAEVLAGLEDLDDVRKHPDALWPDRDHGLQKAKQARYESLLADALDCDDESLAHLVQEDRAVLIEILNTLRWTIYNQELGRAHRLFEVLTKLWSGNPPTVRELRTDLRALGWDRRP